MQQFQHFKVNYALSPQSFSSPKKKKKKTKINPFSSPKKKKKNPKFTPNHSRLLFVAAWGWWQPLLPLLVASPTSPNLS